MLTLGGGGSCVLSHDQSRHLCPSPQTKRWTSRHADCHQAGRECWVRRLQVCWVYWTLRMMDIGGQDHQWRQTTSPSLSPPGTSTTSESQQSEHLLIHLSINPTGYKNSVSHFTHPQQLSTLLSGLFNIQLDTKPVLGEDTANFSYVQSFAVYKLGLKLP